MDVNIVVDAVIKNCLTIVLDEALLPEVFDQSVHQMDYFFYEEYGLILSTLL